MLDVKSIFGLDVDYQLSTIDYRLSRTRSPGPITPPRYNRRRMEIGILGAGNIGASLGRLWAQKGHAIAFGVRDATKTRELVTLTRGRAATLADAAATAAVVVLAVPWSAAADAIAAAGDLAGKIVVDCINPVLPGLRGLAIGRDTSAAEEIARLAPGARVVKAFNTMGAQTLSFAEHLGANGFLCGDDAAAKAVVAG